MKKILRGLFFIVTAYFIAIPFLNAQDEKVCKVGKVVIINRDDSGNITEARLWCETYYSPQNISVINYQIEMDEVGRQMIKKFAEKEVKAIGIVKEADESKNRKTIKILSFGLPTEKLAMEKEISAKQGLGETKKTSLFDFDGPALQTKE